MFGTTNTGMTGIQFQNTSVTFSLQSTPDFADYPYRGTYANSGITAQAYANVAYSGTQASSGYYAPFCQTYNGGVYLYAKSNVGTQTIPTIAVGTASFSLTIDNTPTSGSNNPVSSGGVYSAKQWIEVWSTGSSLGIDSGTGTLNRAVTSSTYTEILLVAKGKNDAIGFASTILPLYGFTPATTIKKNNWADWNVAIIVCNDGTSTGMSMNVQFTTTTTFQISSNSQSRLYAIYVR